MGHHRRRPVLEKLEDRRLLATFLVRNTLDSGPGSLRTAILDANANPGKDTIEFDFAPNATTTVTQLSLASQSIYVGVNPPPLPDEVPLIRPRTPLPEITDPVIIDGTKDVLSLIPLPGVEIRGDRLSGSAVGLDLRTDDSEIRGLVINSFTTFGIRVRDGQDNIINGNYIGAYFENTSGSENDVGIGLYNSDRNAIIGNWLIDNETLGITLERGSAHNTIEMNSIINSGTGINVRGSNNQIGGPGNAGNVIAESGRGIIVDNQFVEPEQRFVGGERNAIQNNRVLNNGTGIQIATGAVQTLIGGSDRSLGNQIAANGSGVEIFGENSGTTIRNNFFGTDAEGKTAEFADGSSTGNELFAIELHESTGNTISGNVIGATNPRGSFIGSTGMDVPPPALAALWLDRSHNNVIQFNRIGISVDGTALPNRGMGLVVQQSSGNQIRSNFVSNTRNAAKGFSGVGIYFTGLGANNNHVTNNFIGTDTRGTAAMGNQLAGIVIDNAPNNTIGGPGVENRNLISGNDGEGIEIRGEDASGNRIRGNYIGTTAEGNRALPNRGIGVSILNAPETIVGGDQMDDGNVISGNELGIAVFGEKAAGSRLQGNFVGIDRGGLLPIPNEIVGIALQKTTEILIGGTADFAGNRVGFHENVGIALLESSSNTIQGNGIGAVTGNAPGGNGTGLALVDSQNNLIGGSTQSSGNTISSNSQFGILLRNEQTVGNQVQGNRIGTGGRGNQTGIVIIDAGPNLIGGASPDLGNQLVDNHLYGIFVNNSDETVITSNRILFNGAQGVRVNESQGVQIIGNFVDDNAGQGIELSGTETTNTLILNNQINSNGLDGVNISLGASHSLVSGNRIYQNGRNGVWVVDGQSHAVLSNSISANADLGIDLAKMGVTPNDVGDGDTGANHRQNAPVLTSVETLSGETKVEGSIQTTANTEVTIQFFSNTFRSANGYGQGEALLGETTVTTNGSGDSAFSVIFDEALDRGVTVAATATVMGSASSSWTSEFSNEVQVPTAETQINLTTAGFQNRQDVAILPDGSYVVAWVDFSTDDANIYFRRYDAFGNPLDNEERLVNTSAERFSSGSVSVGADVNGNFVVAWAAGDVFYRRFDSQGKPLDAEQRQANVIEQGGQGHPDLAVAGNGRFVIVWDSGDFLGPDRPQGDGDYRGIFARRFDVNGDPLDSQEFQVNADSDGDQAYPSIAADAEGNFVAAWTSGNDPFSRSTIMARRYRADGTPLSNDFQANTELATVMNFISKVDVAMADAGQFALAWLKASGWRTGVPAFRMYDSDGQALQEAEVSSEEIELWPRIAMDAQANFVVTTGGPDASLQDVYIRRYNNAGQPIGDAFRVHDVTTGDQSEAVVAMNAQGDFAVAWTSEGQDGDRDGVFARKVDFETDLRLHEFTADGGSTASITYTISGGPVAPFDVRFVVSTDELLDGSDIELESFPIVDPIHLASGEHTFSLPIGARLAELPLPGMGAAEVAGDYFLLAVLDSQDVVFEKDANPIDEDNTVAFVGSYHAPGGKVYVHGGAGSDSIDLASGSVEVTINGRARSYEEAEISGVEVRSHDGDDRVTTAPEVTTPLNAWGGMGDDSLQGGGGNDALDGGPGDDLLDGGPGDDMIEGGPGANTILDSAGDDSVEKRLELTFDRDAVAEADGAAATTATLKRFTDDISSELVVRLEVDDFTEISVPRSVTIPAGQESVTFTVDALADVLLDGTQTVVIEFGVDGFSGGRASLNVDDSESLFVELDRDRISELDGVVQVTVTRSNFDTSDPVEVEIDVADASEVFGMPPTVTIAAGEPSASFSLSAVNNDLLDGRRTVRVAASGEGYQTGEADFVIVDDELNLELSQSSVDENVPVGSEIGILTASDESAEDSFRFELVGDDTDHMAFEIQGNSLRTASLLDFERQDRYQVRVSVTDGENRSLTETFVIEVNDVNETPTDIALSQMFVPENEAVGTVVGELTATDQDADETFRFSLAEDADSPDNDFFAINDSELVTNAIFDFEDRDRYVVKVRAEDRGGLVYEKTFEIQVQDVDEFLREDVDRDGRVWPVDALAIIFHMYRNRAQNNPVTEDSRHLDVDGDGIINPFDALLVIFFLNRRSRSGQGESVSSSRATPADEARQSLHDPAIESALAPPIETVNELRKRQRFF